MITFGPRLVSRNILCVLLVVAASIVAASIIPASSVAPATFAAASSSTSSAEQLQIAGAVEDGPRVADEAVGIANLQLPHAFLQPVPVTLTGLHENVSPDTRNARSILPGGVPSFELEDSPPAAEAPCLDTEGRGRHCWLQTYRC